MSAKVTLTVDDAGFRHDFALATQFANERLKEMANEAKRQTGRAATETGRSMDAMRGATERAASLMGGAFGDVADILFDLGEKATSAIGVVGGATAGVAALSYAAVQLARSADEAAQRLEDAGLAARIPAAAQDSLDHYRESMQSLRIEADVLAVTLAGPLLDALGDAANAMTGLLATLDNAKGAFSGVSGLAAGIGEMLGSDTAETIGQNILMGLTGGPLAWGGAALVNKAAEQVVALGETKAAINENAVAMAQAEKSYKDTAGSVELLTEAQVLEREALEDIERAKKAAADAERAHATAMRQTAEAARQQREELERMGSALAVDAQRTTSGLGGVAAGLDAIKPLADNLAFAAQAQIDAAALQPQLDALMASANQLGASSGGLTLESLGKSALTGGGVSSVLTGGADGVLGALAALPGVGQAAVAIVKLPDLIDGVDATVADLSRMFSDLPERMSAALGETLPGLLSDGIPELAGSLLDAVLQLPVVLLDALPDIISGAVEMVPKLVDELIRGLGENLPELLGTALELAVSQLLTGGPFTVAIAEGVWNGMTGLLDLLPDAIADAIRDLFADIAKPFKGLADGVLGDVAEAGRSLFNGELPSFDRGTSEVTRTGLAVVHRGEEIRRASQAGRSSGAAPIIHVHGSDPREVVRQLREILGGDYGPSYGLGDSLP